MANTDNKCKDLEVRDYYKENGYEDSGSSLADLYNLQAKTQEMYFTKQGRKPFSNFTIGDVVDFLMVTNHAIIDELHEMMDAVGDDVAGWLTIDGETVLEMERIDGVIIENAVN